MQARFVLLCLLSAYSLVGLVYLKWNIFYFVYLYWCENVVHIFFNILKVNSTPHLGNANRSEAIGALGGSLFANFVYFVFIVVGIGIMYPAFVMDRQAGKDAIFQMIGILFFKNTPFNLALVSCLAYKTGEYIRDFWIRPRYNAQNRLPTFATFSKQDMVLHITILLGLGLGFALEHPDFGGKFGLSKSGWSAYSVGIVMILVRLGFEWRELSQAGKVSS
jgi:hypothetical protein